MTSPLNALHIKASGSCKIQVFNSVNEPYERENYYSIFFLSIFAWGVINPDHALATQSHGAPGRIYAHQIAHIFFMLSMGFLSTG
ncbi:MAG: hypothetical protein DRH24_01115 [Deltaproteobacteria bacterium]|nr:MAG: hypothetical protein DRH24_01115 [Deltaproteobacteria bacterium]